MRPTGRRSRSFTTWMWRRCIPTSSSPTGLHVAKPATGVKCMLRLLSRLKGLRNDKSWSQSLPAANACGQHLNGRHASGPALMCIAVLSMHGVKQIQACAYSIDASSKVTLE